MTSRLVRTIVVRLACLLSILLGTYALAAVPPRVTVSSDRQTATVGDRIKFTVQIEHHKDWQQISQPLSQTFGPFDLLHDTSYVDRWGEGDERLHFKRELILAIFKPGGAWIPSLTGLTVMGSDTVAWHSDSLAIMIESVLDRPDADTTDIAGLKGPYVAPEPRWYWWVSGAAALLAIALYLWYRFRRRAALPKAVIPPRPPWELAMRELNALKLEVRPQDDGGRLWYFRLSEILRRYWDGRYNWQSIDQTTTEIVTLLPLAPFTNEQRQRAEEFLHLADRIRYAKQPAIEGRPEVDWQWVRSFVNDTIPLRIVADAPTVKEEEEKALA